MYREDLLFSFKQIRHHTVSTFSLIQTFMLFLEFQVHKPYNHIKDFDLNPAKRDKMSQTILDIEIIYTLLQYLPNFGCCAVLVRVNSVNIHPLAHSLYLHKSIPHVEIISHLLHASLIVDVNTIDLCELLIYIKLFTKNLTHFVWEKS